ncbi:MAG: hypothetical protein QM752_07570 [Gammaproteobacteria bacterium]
MSEDHSLSKSNQDAFSSVSNYAFNRDYYNTYGKKETQASCLKSVLSHIPLISLFSIQHTFKQLSQLESEKPKTPFEHEEIQRYKKQCHAIFAKCFGEIVGAGGFAFAAYLYKSGYQAPDFLDAIHKLGIDQADTLFSGDTSVVGLILLGLAFTIAAGKTTEFLFRLSSTNLRDSDGFENAKRELVATVVGGEYGKLYSLFGQFGYPQNPNAFMDEATIISRHDEPVIDHPSILYTGQTTSPNN